MPMLFSKDGWEAINAIEDGFKEAKKGFENVPSPSNMVPVIKEVAVAGAGVFRIFNGLDAIYNLYSLYKEGLSGSAADVGLRALRATGNLGIIALSGIAAAVAFGVTVIAAPLVGAVLGGVTVVKNALDLLSEVRKGQKIEKKIEALDKELDLEGIHVKQSVQAINDLAQRQEQIAGLVQEHANVKQALYDFKNAPDSKKVDLINQRLKSLGKNIDDNLKINSFIADCGPKLKDIKFLEKSIEKTKDETILKFATELKDSQLALSDIQKEIDLLPNKYNKSPFDKLSTDQKKGLISLDRELLEGRKKEFESKISQLIEPTQRLQENHKFQSEISSYRSNEPAKNNEAYTKCMTDRLSEIKGSVKEKHESLKERKKYTQLFLGKDVLDKGPAAISEKLDAKFAKTLERAKLTSDLKLCQIEKKKKWKNIGLGLAGLGIAIAACIPPVQALLGLGLIIVGVVSGVNAIYDYKMKNKEKDIAKKQEAVLEKANTIERVAVLGQLQKQSPQLEGLQSILSNAQSVEGNHAEDAQAHDHKATVVHSLNAISSQKVAKSTSVTPTSPEQDPVPTRPRAGSSGTRT